MKYRKRPLEVEVFQWNGNFGELVKFIGSYPTFSLQDEKFLEIHHHNESEYVEIGSFLVRETDGSVGIYNKKQFELNHEEVD